VPSLADVEKGLGWEIYNRSAISFVEDTYQGVRLDAKPGAGLAWVPEIELADGVIEVDLRGKDEPGQSFVGIAFHGSDAQTYEGVYLRPFNFRAQDPERRAHAVQYISHPEHTWSRLRTEHPGQYEARIEPAPDPSAWIHLRVVLAGAKVSVYVDHSEESVLVIDSLSDRDRGWVGLWVGNNSDGDFANLRVTPQ
jgi:hypothetical protein